MANMPDIEITMRQFRTAEIAGITYANLASTLPMRFVDIKGNILGSLDALTPTEAKALKPKFEYIPVDDLYVAMSGMEWEPNVLYVKGVKRMSDTLSRLIKQAQEAKRIDVIVVDSNVMDAVRGSGQPMDKLFLPRIHDPFQHTFYAYDVIRVVESPLKNEEIMKFPSANSRIKKL